MELNRRKYNFMVVALIILISIVMIFSAVTLTDAEVEQPSSDLDISAEEDKKPEDENGNQEVVVPTNKNYLPEAPAFSTGWKQLSYAYEIMDKYSYSSSVSQTAVNDEIMGIVVRQNVKQKKYKTDNECLILEVGTCSSSEGLNYSQYLYLNEGQKSIISRVCMNSDSNYTNEPINKYTKVEYKNKCGTDVKNSYIKLSSKNATLDSFSIKGSRYELKITLNANAEGVFDNMEKFVLSAPAEMQDFSGISASYEIKIDRKTGAFISIKSTERYYVKKKTAFGMLGSTITSISTETFDFANINIDNLIKSTLGN